ncbi:proprotein convertase subtilisin/kexin type 5 [Brachionichthys hirsutus]|uniref:proprotein convertase subtilisin/kexin type 5 n=1 Tax=Brachionichthys hirsutus TaxID=412623 RepID=UPI003604D60C
MGNFYALWVGTLLHLCHASVYTNDWAVRIRADRESVDRIAHKYGFTNMGQIGTLKGYYSFQHQGTAKRSAASGEGVTVSIAKEAEVEWVQQQVVFKRSKRSPRLGDIDAHCSDEPKRCQAGMNIAGAWRRGYTGKGVVVSVLDDGIQTEHPDLKPNYDPVASYDVNGHDPDPDPSPNHSNNISNYHGTQCAGVVAAAASSSRCTVGVAFQAGLGGIRMLDGDVTDIVEAQSLSFRPQYIDIYLASWGPRDDGATLEGPGTLTRLALHSGIKTGRRGRGSVFVWASGNGGQTGDHCSCDGYSSSVSTISISSAAPHGGQADYLERCSSTLAAALTAGESPQIVTLGPKGSCSVAKPHTSFSSSVAAGVIALMLEANPFLTWRDVQHILVRTSQARHLSAPDWRVNGAGHKVSHLYGFGLLNAESAVQEAERWKRVPSQHACAAGASTHLRRTIHPGSTLTSVFQSAGCSDKHLQHVAYVEHVVVLVTIAHSRRGDLSITLTSPSGTVSQLLDNRPLDDSTEGFQNWEFMSTHFWGEKAAGKWTLKIQDTPSQRAGAERGTLQGGSLMIYGTAQRPYPTHHKQARSAETPLDGDVTEEFSGSCDPECSGDGCDGPGPQQCVTCLHFFLKFKNNTRTCVSECPRGFWGDRRRCKRCYSSCESCTGSRSDQCASCQPGYHLTEGTHTCAAVCGDDHYLDHDANTCRRCSDNCFKCTSYSFCTECKPDTSLQGNRCQQSCTAGFYHDEQEGTCKPCHEACATCAGAGAEACDRCADGFLMEEWRCVAACSSGFYPTEPGPEIADGLCRRCDASCLTCVGASRGDCSSCSSGHSLKEGVCVVNTECTEGQFQDAEGKCYECDATCLKCTGPQREECISCHSSQPLDEGRCLTECAEGQYQSGGRCHLCDHTCATCLDAGRVNCSSCDTDKFGVERYLYGGRCVDACPEAFYHTVENTCERCSDHCRVCTGPARCLSCSPSYYLSGGVCVKLECGEGEVEDPDYDDCMACEEGCRKCVLYNPKHCLSCTEGFYTFQDGCYKNCPAKTYSVAEEMSCVPCDDECVSCDEDECYWCETDLFLSEGSCVSDCPDGFYGDENTNDCEECHPDCVTCGGPEDDDCLSCDEDKTLENGECASEHEACPAKTFRSADGGCEGCHPTCESCSGEENNQCTDCAKGSFLTSQRTCVAQCPGGFFADGLGGVCASCPPGCLQCLDALRCSRCRSTQAFLQDGRCVQECDRGYPVGQVCRTCVAGCASCRWNATLCLSCEAPLLLHEHQCLQACPPAHAVRDGRCQRCPSACQACDPPGRCTGCEENHLLHEGLCLPDCPGSSFGDRARGECLRCHADCTLCDGPDSDDCDSCADPEAVLHNGACLEACPAHTYREAETGECKDCDASCLTCSGPHAGSCTSCREDRRLEGHGRCSPCSPRQYADRDGECHPCHKSCRTCSGPGSGPGRSLCLSCNQRHRLLDGTCVAECPSGYYGDESGQTCEPCHPSCQSCIGKHGNECLACKSHLFREGKGCVETCQHSHYGNTDSRVCDRCDPSCSECTGGGEDGCLSCAPGLVYLRGKGRCLLSCPRGFYDDSAHGRCELCHASCRTCSGKDSRSCDSCYPGYQRSGGACESLCGGDQYPVLKGSGHACEGCHASCLTCRGPGPADCTTCPARAMLEAGGRCLLCCYPEEEEEEEAAGQQQDCCNCTKSRGECVLSTNLPFRNEEEEEAGGNLVVFIVACVLLVLGTVAVFFLIRHSRSKSVPSELPPRGYEKLGSGGGFGGGGYSSASSASYSGQTGSSGSKNQDTQLVDIGECRLGRKDDEDEDDDEDIVYMGQDGTVYRKFRYGHLGGDNEDELEYDDESYTFR